MLETALFLLNNILLLVFGLVLTVSFCGIRFNRKNSLVLSGLFLACGLLQLVVYCCASETAVRELYPLITHLPLILALCLYFRKNFLSAFAAICTAYLCCQPAKWFGVLVLHLTQSVVLEYAVRILILLLCGYLALAKVASSFAGIFSKDPKSVLIFGITPMVYYFYDYTVSVYQREWVANTDVAMEFLHFFLSVVFVLFCCIYYAEYEQKNDAEQKEQILRITARQQAKEVETVRRNSQEIKLLRHDMRLFLSSLAVCIEDDNREKALEMISGYTSRIEGTRPEYFCAYDTVNYVLSDFAAKCQAEKISFQHTVEISQLDVDEMMLSMVLSNALDNALNAQLDLPEGRRQIKLMLKNSSDKLLLSVKNPISQVPTFVDGIPVTENKDHGYGTKSIRYLTERLGGNCQFSTQDGQFLVRIIF